MPLAAIPDQSPGSFLRGLKRRSLQQRFTTWLDAQHQCGVIAQRAAQRLVPRVVVAMGLIDHIHIRPHRTRRLEAAAVAGAAGEASAGQAAVVSRAGREQIRLSCTRLPRCGHLLQSV